MHPIGHIVSPETREKIRRALTGKPHPHRGKSPSPETREKMRQAKLGKKMPEHLRLQLKERIRGSGNPFYGHHHTEANKEKIRQLHLNNTYTKGRPLSDTHKENLRKSHAGRFTGPLSSQWKGGVTTFTNTVRGLFEYRQWERSVIGKYKCVCQKTGVKLPRHEMRVHHIKSFSTIMREYNIKTVEEARGCCELWDINNGIVLSKEQHTIFHSIYGNSNNDINQLRHFLSNTTERRVLIRSDGQKAAGF